MRYNVQNLAFLSAVITFASCQQHKNSAIDDSGTEVVKVRQPTEDTIEVSSAPTEQVEVTDAVATETPAKPEVTTVKTSKPEVTVVKAPKPEDQSVAKPGRNLTVKGIVKDINNGKDGYTAKLETTDGKMVAVTISRSNLRNPKQYRTVEVGETLKVSGESWTLGGDPQITVREIL